MLDAIYWRLHSSFLRNEREDARRFLAMLEDELGELPSKLASEIGPAQMERFRKIKDRVSRGEFGRLYGPGESVGPVYEAPRIRERSGPEKEFCRALLKERERLLGAMDMEFWADIVPEVDMDPFGRCDFVAREGRTVAVVEVKMGEAPTSVVSQIDKYRLAAELDMCIGTHDEVLAYVVAENFQPYVATELSRLSVNMILHKGSPRTLRKAG